MTSEQRRHYDNGIWLCRNCGTLVDADQARYPAQLLRQWKMQAEVRSVARLGQRQPSEADAQEVLSMALRGTGSMFVPGAISNAHSAIRAVLEAADPRLSISTAFDGKQTRIGLHPKTSIQLKALVPAERSAEWQREMTKAHDWGAAVRISMEGVRFTGTPVFDLLQGPSAPGSNAVLSVSPLGKPAASQIRFVTHPDFMVDPFTGYCVAAAKALRFEGTAMGGLLKLVIVLPYRPAEGAGELEWLLSIESWDKLDITRLPYFSSAKRIEQLFSQDQELDVSVSVEGEPWPMGRIKLPATQPHDSLNRYLGYIDTVRQIGLHIGQPICLDLSVAIDMSDVVFAEAVLRMLKEGAASIEPPNQPQRMRVGALTEGFMQSNWANDEMELGAIAISYEAPEALFFGQTVQLPPLDHLFLNCSIRLCQPSVSLNPGDTAEAEILRRTGYTEVLRLRALLGED
jgi:hypothetical protein